MECIVGMGDGLDIRIGTISMELIGGSYSGNVNLGARPKFAFVKEPNNQSGPVWMSSGQLIGNSSVSAVLTDTGISIGAMSTSGTAYYLAVM